MNDFFSNDDDLINYEEVTGKTSNDGSGLKNDFKPWHKPRKQYVRENQWWFNLQRTISSPNYQQIQTIKYFGLPGADLLDVYYFGIKLNEDISLNSKSLLVHGFIDNANDKAHADSRMSEILDMKQIHSESIVEKHNFCELSKPTSIALTRIQNFSGYHFINLDFCNSIFKDVTLKALMQLMVDQFRFIRGIPWLLCITTRADINGIDEELLKKLSEIYSSRLPKDTVLHETLLEVCSSLYPDIEHIDIEALAPDRVTEALQLSFIYWTICQAHDRNCLVELISSMKYKINKNTAHPDMYSYVFKFTKHTALGPDPAGLIDTSQQDLSNRFTPAKCISNKKGSITKFTTRCLDIDNFLLNHPEINAAIITRKKALLEASGWDISTYDVVMANL